MCLTPAYSIFLIRIFIFSRIPSSCRFLTSHAGAMILSRCMISVLCFGKSLQICLKVHSIIFVLSPYMVLKRFCYQGLISLVAALSFQMIRRFKINETCEKKVGSYSCHQMMNLLCLLC